MSTDHGYPTDINRRCTGTTNAGHQCKKHPLVGRPFCAFHGGEAAERRRANADNRQTTPLEVLKVWEQFLQQDNSGEEGGT